MAWRQHALMLALVTVPGCRQILGIDDVSVATDATSDVTEDAADLVTDDGWRSGSRLRLAWNDYNGARVDFTLEDSMLGVTCFPYAWADGKRYCAPRNLPPSFEGVGFLDAACTQPVGYRLHRECSIETAPVFLTQWTRQACIGDLRSTVYRRGTLRLGGTLSLYMNHTGTCEASAFPASNYDLYNLLEEVPPSELVEMSTVLVPIDDRISRVDYRGSDGSSYASGAYDTQLDTACTFSAMNVCLPSNTSGDVFLDSACSVVAASAPAGCPAPRFAYARTRPDCTISAVRYYDVGQARTPSTLYQSSGASCYATAIQTSQTYYEATTEVALASLAPTVDAGGAEIVRERRGAGDEGILVGPYAGGLGGRCTTLGGRCLPADSASVSSYFSDAGCTVPIEVAIVSAAGTSPTCPSISPPKFAIRQTTTACATSYALVGVGSPHMGTLYTGTPSACSATNPGFAVYALGGVEDLTSYPQAQRLTE